MAAVTKATPKKKPAQKTAATKRPPAKQSAKRKVSAGRGPAAKKPAPRKNLAPEQPLMKALRAEHLHIATVMELFEQQLRELESGKPVDSHVLFEIMEYMVTWPDRYHHPREDLIYSRVAELDAAAADEVDTLQRDHDQSATSGRELLLLIERWREGDASAESVVKAGLQYIADSYQHMNIEEKMVYPHIESILTLEDWRELAEDDRLRAVSESIFGPRVQREFRNMTRKLRRGVRRGVEHGTMVQWIGIEALMESLDVLSLAVESARTSAGDHLRAALDESKDMFKQAPLAAPVRCTVNNTKLTVKLLEDVASISRDALEDLSRVNRARRERGKLLDR